MAHVEDRWWRTVRGADGRNRKERTPRHGKGRRWRARYEDPDGRERGRSFPTRVAAENFLTEVEHSKLAGTYRDPDAGRITLRKYAVGWLAAQSFDPVTRATAESRLRNHVLGDHQLGGRLLTELAARPSVIQGWVSGLALSPVTAAKVFELLNSVMIAALTDGLIARNPCRARIRLPKVTQRRVVPWTAAQAAAVRAALAERWRPVVDAGAELGLRQSEIFGLAEDEIGFLDLVVHVRQQVKLIDRRLFFAPPKGRKERTVPMTSRTGVVLFDHAAAFAAEVTLPWHEPGTRRHGRPHTSRLLFTTADGRPIHRNVFNSYGWMPARRAAGIPAGREHGCHMLRHLYASRLIAGGVDVRTVAEYLGHADGGALVLRTYSHLMPDAEERARRAIEEALSGHDHGPVTAPGGDDRG